MIMTTSWLHALLGIIHNAASKFSWKKKKKKKKKHKKVCENKETDSPTGIYRMNLPGTCSLSKESHEKKKKKKKNGTSIFGEWDSYFFTRASTFYKKGVPDSYF